jgi:hypothetical protein
MHRPVPKPLPANAALIVIDVQKAIDHPSWGARNNPEAKTNIAALLRVWRTSGRPVHHMRCGSLERARPRCCPGRSTGTRTLRVPTLSRHPRSRCSAAVRVAAIEGLPLLPQEDRVVWGGPCNTHKHDKAARAELHSGPVVRFYCEQRGSHAFSIASRSCSLGHSGSSREPWHGQLRAGTNLESCYPQL